MAKRTSPTAITKVGMPSVQDAQAAQQRLRRLADPAVAAGSARFFKIAPGEYGEGEIFIGIKSPTLKTVAKEFKALPLAEVECLLHSDIRIAKRLLTDKEDLIHKAVGWMLREVGKRDVAMLEDFLGKHCGVMPRTMLRYAMERLPDEKRRAYLKAMP